MVSILFVKDSVPAPFLGTLNTENALVFRVPDNASGGQQNIRFTNIDGKTLEVPFNVIALPSVTTASLLEFSQDQVITLSGNNFNDVSAVVLQPGGETVTVVSKTKTQMVIKMPLSSADRVNIKITNTSGDRITSQEFINIDKAKTVFSEQLDNGFQDWGWGGAFAASTDDKISGTKSFKAAYDPAGTWGGMQLGNNGSIDISQKTTFSFWTKGADVDKQMQFWLNWGVMKVITVPARVWTRFQYTLASDYPGLTSVNNVTFQIYDAGKTIYFDNIMFYK
jgi:hypothetical protein